MGAACRLHKIMAFFKTRKTLGVEEKKGKCGILFCSVLFTVVLTIQAGWRWRQPTAQACAVSGPLGTGLQLLAFPFKINSVCHVFAQGRWEVHREGTPQRRETRHYTTLFFEKILRNGTNGT